MGLLFPSRLQVGGARGGIVFATKAHVQEIAKCAGSSDLAVLPPASDNIALPLLQNKLQGPFEVSVDDASAKIAYKRLVMLFIVRGTINYKLPTPIAKLTTGAVCEIVLEIDGRLVAKSDLDKYRESPIASFKTLLGQIAPKLDNSAVIFGYRVANHPSGAKQDPLLQCILKAPHAVRTPLIEASGFTPLLSRDFLEKGRNSEDTTVLPRFWPPTLTELSNVRKTVEGTEGLAGLVLTRRGIAPRVWVAKIGKARAQLLADDPRVIPENIDVIPKYTFSLAGWPAATGAQHVVTSTLQALKLPVLPLRTYRAAGVHVWIVTTDKKPDVSSFPLQINADVVEILIQEVEHGPVKQALFWHLLQHVKMMPAFSDSKSALTRSKPDKLLSNPGLMVNLIPSRMLCVRSLPIQTRGPVSRQPSIRSNVEDIGWGPGLGPFCLCVMSFGALPVSCALLASTRIPPCH